MVTFTDIVKEQRQQGAGVFSSLGKAAGQRTLERIDPRNYLFKRSGLLTALFPGLKGYQAKGGSSEMKSPGASSPLGQTNLVVDKLDELKAVQRETAKNTLVLPIIARDMNVMRQNILKLVKLSGGKPSSRADSFFMSARDRESAYESRFGKKSPTKNNEMKAQEKESILSKLFGWLFSGFKGGLAGVLQGLLTTLLKGGLLIGLLVGIGKYFNDPEFRKKVNETLDTLLKSVFGADYWENIKTGLLVVVGGLLAVKTALIAFEVFMYRLISRLAGVMGTPTGIPDAIPDKGGKPKGGKASKPPVPKTGVPTSKGGIKGLAGQLLSRGNVGTGLLLYSPELGNAEVPDFERKLQENRNTSPTKTELTSLSPTPTSEDSGSFEKAEEYLGRKMSEDEKDALLRAVSAESSMNSAEYANVMAVILNRARNSNKSIIDVLQEKNQFQSVTGTANNPGPDTNYRRGPNQNQLDMILESTNSLPSISKNLDAFTSANPEAYKLGTNIGYLDKLRDSGGKQIGQTVFAENQYSGGSKSSMTLASAASAMPNMNDMGKFLNQGSADFEAMVRDFLASSGMVNINNDSSTKVSTTNASQDGPPGSAYDSDMFTAMVDSAINYS
jgi:hypothetical protein